MNYRKERDEKDVEVQLNDIKETNKVELETSGSNLNKGLKSVSENVKIEEDLKIEENSKNENVKKIKFANVEAEKIQGDKSFTDCKIKENSVSINEDRSFVEIPFVIKKEESFQDKQIINLDEIRENLNQLKEGMNIYTNQFVEFKGYFIDEINNLVNEYHEELKLKDVEIDSITKLHKLELVDKEDKLKDEYDNVISEMNKGKLEEKIEILNKTIDLLKDADVRYEKLRKSINILGNKHETFKEKYLNLKEMNEKIENENKKLQICLDEKEDDISDMMVKLTHSAHKSKMNLDAIDFLNKEKEGYMIKHNNLINENNLLKDKIKVIKQFNVNDLVSEILEIQMKIQELNGGFIKIKENNEYLCNRNKDLESLTCQLNVELKSTTEHLRVENDKIVSLKTEIINDLNEKHLKASELINKQKSVIESLREEREN
ncbi:hypothetical protein A0H76_950 [Hepatospora eriocheir]|uniref:Uncharacterized protein n=1 Tax=Hepatospora eriocheir TaxID=1081669 RepID=A0A1X0QHW4_9MICR|nr:hypothetical protein A0H76_950 [Hepatospora eriocheir]